MITEQGGFKGDAGVKTVLEQSIFQLSCEGVTVGAVPLGGTVAMMVSSTGELVAEAPEAFGSRNLHNFNQQKIGYAQSRIEPTVSSPLFYNTDLLYTTGQPFPPLAATNRVKQERISKVLETSGAWPDMITEWGIPSGTYPAIELTRNLRAAPTYARVLAEEIYTGNYPNGIRFDSNEVYDASCVWGATVCGYLVPTTLTEVHKIAKEQSVHMGEALKQTIIVVPIGTDRQKEVASFLDVLAYYSGLTFITIGANSPFGTSEGDAEQNLNDTQRASSLIGRGILPRGYAYSVADGMVMNGILQKMDPSARGLKTAVSAPDGYMYGGTFLAHKALSIDEIEKNGFPLIQHKPYDPSLLWLLSSSKLTEKDDRTTKVGFIRENAACLTLALNAIQRVSPLAMPSRLNEGTQAVIIEGGGEGNGAAQTAHVMEYLAAQQWARTDRKMKPTVVVASEAGIPYVGQDYSASLIKTLREAKLIRGVVSARGLPGHIATQLIALSYYPKVVYVTGGISFDKTDEYIDPLELEELFVDYGKSRQFKGF